MKVLGVCFDSSLGFLQGSSTCLASYIYLAVFPEAWQTLAGRLTCPPPLSSACRRTRPFRARVLASLCPSQKTTRLFPRAPGTPQGAPHPLPATCQVTTSMRRTELAT